MTSPSDKPKYFGAYELLEKLGRGNTAVVFKARQRTTGEIVAIKIGVPFLKLDRPNFERFRREFTLIQNIKHPHLVRALEFSEYRSFPFLVQEFIAGQSLEKHLRDGGFLSLTEGIDAILQVADGLRTLHQNQLLHRDVKPGNIFLDARGQAKLGDFGLLKTLSAQSGLTKSRQAMGTIEFGAPEQFEDARHVDARCDIYSLATTFYTAVTGLFPFGSGSMRRVLLRKLRDKFIPLSCLLPAAPAELDDLISRSIRANREQRP